MCQFNLDAYQDAVNKRFDTKFNLPILYFTQMIGLALGLSEQELGIGQELTSAKTALSKISDEEPPKPKKVRRTKEALPVPTLLEEV
jgi:heterodisulfide reductase subunit B